MAWWPGTGRPSAAAVGAWVSLAGAAMLQRQGVAPIGNVMAVAIYWIIWWVFLFAVLPLGVRTQSDEGKVIQGTSAGAPVSVRMGRVAALTTIVASVMFAVLLFVLRWGIIPLG